MARKGENIYYRKDRRWEGRYLKAKEDGKVKYGYVFAPTYAAAKKKLQDAKEAWKTRCMTLEQEKTTLSAVSAHWLAEAKHFDKESTIAKYRDFLHCYILPRFGNIQIDALSTEEGLQDFLSALLVNGGADGQGLSTRTVAGVLCILKSIRGYAIKQGYLDTGGGNSSLRTQQEKVLPLAGRAAWVCGVFQNEENHPEGRTGTVFPPASG